MSLFNLPMISLTCSKEEATPIKSGRTCGNRKMTIQKNIFPGRILKLRASNIIKEGATRLLLRLSKIFHFDSVERGFLIFSFLAFLIFFSKYGNSCQSPRVQRYILEAEPLYCDGNESINFRSDTSPART